MFSVHTRTQNYITPMYVFYVYMDDKWYSCLSVQAPEEDYFSVHIRIVGDWTEEVARQMGIGRGDFQQSWELPRIAIDGPFGTASEVSGIT